MFFGAEVDMAENKRWSDWWRQFLGFSSDGYHRAVEVLTTRYVEESQHVARFTEHAQRMQYPQFRDKLLAIAADEAKHVEWLAEKIRLFGGRIPDVPPISAPVKNSWQYLLEDLNEGQICDAELLAEAQSLREELRSVAEVLERIYQDGIKHRDEIRKMLMKSDPQSLSAWLA
jgi:rubrerythrin